jgi:hypothetical protein
MGSSIECKTKADHEHLKVSLAGADGFIARAARRIDLFQMATEGNGDVAGLLEAERSPRTDEDMEPVSVG